MGEFTETTCLACLLSAIPWLKTAQGAREERIGKQKTLFLFRHQKGIGNRYMD
jgi:hypothetical protein